MNPTKIRRRTGKIALSLGVCGALMTGLATSASANTFGKYGGQIPRGGVLNRGEWIGSGPYGDTLYRMNMQTDGNLVIYLADGSKVCWASNTAGRGVRANYQTDGNFVIYNSSSQPVWASNTKGKGGDTTNVNIYGALYVGTTRVSNNC